MPRALRALIVLTAVVLPAIADAAPPPPAKRTKTVVVGIQGRRGVDPDLARAMADVVQSVLTTDTTRVVLGRDDIAQVVQLEAEKQAMGCSDSSCLSEVATALDADRIVTGTMDKVGTSFLIVITEIDARALEPVARVEATVPADESKLIDAVRSSARELLAKSPRMAPGGPPVLVVSSNPPGAEVYVDDRLVGKTPLTTGELAPGDHKVRLRPIGAPVVEFTAPVGQKGATAVDVKVGAVGTITPDQLADLDERRGANTLWGALKLVGGGLCTVASLPFCCASCLVMIPTDTPPDVVSGAVLGIPGALLLLPGVGLATWGVLDFMNPPTLTGEGNGSSVTITPPDGAARTFDVPFPMAN